MIRGTVHDHYNEVVGLASFVSWLGNEVLSPPDLITTVATRNLGVAEPNLALRT